MTTKEQLLQELEQTPEDLIAATLNFLRSAKAQQTIVASEASAANPLLALLAEFDEFAANIPPDELSHLPTDGAEQHNHYLYGAPEHSTHNFRPCGIQPR
jgi:hypothetical protein